MTTATARSNTDLEEVELHSVLSNERRWMMLELLAESGKSMSARELSERIAEWETGQRPPPRNARQSAYVSLMQTHLPKLIQLDIVEFDESAKTVRFGSRGAQVSKHIGLESKSFSSNYRLVIGFVGIAVTATSMAAGPVVETQMTFLIAIVLFLSLIGLEVRQFVIKYTRFLIEIPLSYLEKAS